MNPLHLTEQSLHNSLHQSDDFVIAFIIYLEPILRVELSMLHRLIEDLVSS